MSKPYTVRFGPWLPDLQNVGVEMPFQWSETELPVADCENVYYQDAAYRCLPAPASIGPSLGTQILDAATWYDQTQGKEIVFAATANGFFQLVDGAWTQIPVQQNASAGTVGFAISIRLGDIFGTAVYLSPQSQSYVGTTSSHTFSPVGVTVGNGTPTAYNWTFSGQTGTGTWAVLSGQGDSAAVPAVSGVPADSTTTVNFNCATTINGVVYSCSGTLSYQNAPAPAHFTYTSGSGTITVPTGYNTVVIEVASGSQGGEGGYYNSSTHQSYGGTGGSSASYSRSQYTCSAGQTLNYSVGAAGTGGAGGNYGAPTAGGTSTVSSGTLSITTITAPNLSVPTGGNQVNTSANTGTAGSLNVKGTGGAAISGEYITAPAGGNGGLGTLAGSAGGTGIVSVYFTYVP